MTLDNIFRAYDIRGIFGSDLTEEVAENIGRAFGTILGENKTVVVGRDGRLNGPRLRDSLISGLNSVGCNAIDVGVVTTSVLYFSVPNFKADAGAMITASHNPKEWNGFKMCDSNGLIYHGDVMQQIKKIIEGSSFRETGNRGTVREYPNIFEDYSRYALSKVKPSRRLKIVVDSGNGAAGLYAPAMFESMGNEVIRINENLDGNFPGRGPDPTKENVLKELKQAVIRERADMGAAFDGDGDRIVFVDDKGREISSGSLIIMIIAKDILQRKRGGRIVFDCCCSSQVPDYIKENGGIPVTERVGHSFIIHRMQIENAAFAGEYSNHFYFPEIPGYDDAVFAGLRMIEILSKSGKKLSEIIDSFPKTFYKFDVEFPCTDDKKFEIIEKLKGSLASQGYKTSDFEGVRVIFDDGWVLWRASNTSPKIIAFIEGPTQERFDEMMDFANSQIGKFMGGD